MSSEPSGLDWFLGAAYHADLRTSMLGDVVNPVRSRLTANSFDQQSVEIELSRQLDEMRHTDLIGGQQAASDLLVADDLELVLKAVTDPDISESLSVRRDMTLRLEQVAQQGAEELTSIGLPTDVPDLYFVDDYPEPYSNLGADVLAIDLGDKKEFGIEPGIYFRSTVRPFYSEFLLLHELIHTSLGQRSPDEFSSRLEEGVAEVVGSAAVGLKMLGGPLIRRLFIYNRPSRASVRSWERYLDATRQVWWYVQAFGLDSLTANLRKGREALNAVEDALLSMDLEKLGSEHPRPTVDPELSSLLNKVCLVYPRTLVVSPGAALIAPYLAPGATLAEAAQAARMELSFAEECAAELQNEHGLLALRPDNVVVVFGQAHRVSDTRAVRYSLEYLSSNDG